MRFRRPTPLDQGIEEEGGVAAAVPLRAAGLPEKNTFIQFPQERGGVAPVGAFTTPANLAPNLGAPLVHVHLGGSPMIAASPMRSVICSPMSSMPGTPSTMCGSPPNRFPAQGGLAPPQPGFLRCISDPTGGMDSAMPAWCHWISPSHLNSSLSGQPMSPLAPAFQPHPHHHAPLAPLVQNKMMGPGPLLAGPKLPPGAMRVEPRTSVVQRPYLLPAPQMAQVMPVPVAPRVLKFSYTVPGNPVQPVKLDGREMSENNGMNM